MYEHILITTDGSVTAQKGVDHGLSLAKALGAKVTIVTVSETFPLYVRGATPDAGGAPVADYYTARQKSEAEHTLAIAKQAADRLKLTAETLHVMGAHPAEAVIEAATERNCSLIVMASHGRRGFGRLVLGSVTAEVLAHSAVPVLVVR